MNQTDYQAENNCKYKQRSFQQKTQSKISIWVLGQAALCALSSSPTCFRECWHRLFFVWNSLPLPVLGQKSERKPKRPKKSQRGQGVSRKKVLHSSQSSVYKRLWKHQHLQESRKKTLHSEQLQSARDCWSRSISKRGKCQERRFYTAAKAQSTRDCRRVNISKGDKKEGSTQQPKLSLQETAEE